MLIHALIGHPISSSLSPAIHGYIYNRLGLDAAYVPLDISPKRLMHVVEVARDAFNGFNVTIPHKVAIVRYLDALKGPAALIGAVNTVLIRDAEAIGHNTDAEALIDLMLNRGIKCGVAMVLGAGGAARAALAALSGRCRSIVVTNRTRSRAEELRMLGERLGLTIEVINFENRVETLPRVDLIINATPLGMYDHGEPLPLEPLRSTAPTVIDLAYSRSGTPLSTAAKELGLPLIDGLDVLIRQAIKSEELWLGRPVPIHDDEVRGVIMNGG